MRYARLLLVLVGLAFAAEARAQSVDWFAYQNPALSNSVQTVKASPGPLLGYICYNPNATVAYIQIFDTTSSVTLGTTVPTRFIQVAGLSTTGLQVLNSSFYGSLGIKVAATTTQNGGTAPSTGLSCEFYYR